MQIWEGAFFKGPFTSEINCMCTLSTKATTSMSDVCTVTVDVCAYNGDVRFPSTWLCCCHAWVVRSDHFLVYWNAAYVVHVESECGYHAVPRTRKLLCFSSAVARSAFSKCICCVVSYHHRGQEGSGDSLVPFLGLHSPMLHRRTMCFAQRRHVC